MSGHKVFFLTLCWGKFSDGLNIRFFFNIRKISPYVDKILRDLIIRGKILSYIAKTLFLLMKIIIQEVKTSKISPAALYA